MIRKGSIIVIKAGIAVSLICYLFVSKRFELNQLTGVLDLSNIKFVIIAALCFIISQYFAAYRLMLLLRAIGVYISFNRILFFTLAGLFYGQLTVGVGGDVVKGVYLFREENNDKGKSSGVLIMDRVIGLCSLMVLAIAATGYLLFKNNLIFSVYSSELLRILFVVAMLLLSAVFLLFLARNHMVRSWFKKIVEIVFKRGTIFSAITGFSKITKDLNLILFALVISALLQIASLAGLVVLGGVVSAEMPGGMTVAAVSSLVFLFNVIPITPGNIGWAEFLAAFGWSAVGSSGGAAVFLLWRMVVLVCLMPWGLWCIFERRNSNSKLDVV